MNDIKNGAAFSNVAAEKSQEPQTAGLGGETGWVIETQLLAPILKTVKDMKVGEVVGPISVPTGYVVLQLMGKRSAPKPTLEQARMQLIATIKQQAWDKYVLKLRTEQGARLVTALPEK
jgi:parvulin-like peptidyl-prolyl isomerase